MCVCDWLQTREPAVDLNCKAQGKAEIARKEAKLKAGLKLCKIEKIAKEFYWKNKEN